MRLKCLMANSQYIPGVQSVEASSASLTRDNTNIISVRNSMRNLISHSPCTHVVLTDIEWNFVISNNPENYTTKTVMFNSCGPDWRARNAISYTVFVNE